MISMKMVAAAAAAMMVVGSGVALAKDANKPVTPVVHSPDSIQCSKEADAKGLHGKERKKFRAHCKHEMKKQRHMEKKS
jgi:hypothetical protein